ncbi:MAG: glycosyltransferase family 2 protein [Blastocatellia bacterium]|nr:MAG: glycosyltransferase family 2 protein [Blastocatellia bacterium]
MVELSIIIVSFNTRADLERCLHSLVDTPAKVSHEIIVVDNSSSDGSANAARHWTGVRVIETGTNLGFARANNIGIRASTGEALLLLNSDTVVPPDALDRLVGELKRDSSVGVVGPRLVDANGRPELSFGSMIGPFTELRQKILVRGQERGWGFATEWIAQATQRTQFPDWVSGACLLVRRADAEAAGLLDERFFMYAEDVDFCAAIRAHHRRIRFTPDVTVVHHRGQSVRTARESTEIGYRQSQIAFYEKHHPLWAPLLRIYLRIRGVVIPDRAGGTG